MGLKEFEEGGWEEGIDLTIISAYYTVCLWRNKALPGAVLYSLFSREKL